MKTRLLPPTDLARIAPLPTDDKVAHLRRFQFGAVPFTYNPVRRAIPDILQASGSLFESLGPTPMAYVEQNIRRARMSEMGIEQNLKVARALNTLASVDGYLARQREFYSMTIGFIDQIKLWSDLALIIEGKPLAVFFDTRRGNRLSPVGRKFTFSLQHQHIRLADPDMASADLAVVQFPVSGTERYGKLFRAADMELFTYEQLEAMISETYRLWREISEERFEETKRRSGSAGGLL
ncbi:MAG: hypothetical protein Q7J13_15215 [Brevundimonas sp.]|uniref:type VI toxin-antitoxin system SocB family DNA replication inhibitor toxin n=1 Tax=Brevundimonas sp. TaxID=1871086 RepID=UPI00271E314F|nr:hypothetical protein [Brevundimonas sp.]MDO9589262.1 hypothetical protein [Brevundimonas sp.]